MVGVDTATLISCISDINELKYLKDIIDAKITYLQECNGTLKANMKPEEQANECISIININFLCSNYQC